MPTVNWLLDRAAAQGPLTAKREARSSRSLSENF